MNQKGFGVLIVLILGAVLAIGAGGYVFLSKNKSTEKSVPDMVQVPAASPIPDDDTPLSTEKKAESKPAPQVAQKKPEIKQPDQEIKQIEQKSCPDPFIFDLPADINKVTSVLYPGQVRGGDFKAHGGFRFDTSRNAEITVVAPIDAFVMAGARYPVNGEIQYTFDFEHPCGIRYRLGHLLTLTPKFQAIAEKFPLPSGLDSRTTEVSPRIAVKKGEVIATAVGLTVGNAGQNNTFFDWGVYDYRQKNEASKDPTWAAAHTSDTYQYAVCWFDWISPENRMKVVALPPADGMSGKQSDYCK